MECLCRCARARAPVRLDDPLLWHPPLNIPPMTMLSIKMNETAQQQPQFLPPPLSKWHKLLSSFEWVYSERRRTFLCGL